MRKIKHSKQLRERKREKKNRKTYESINDEGIKRMKYNISS